ncbi:MAG: SDR family NAD(P)-dependent oxidoreductase [Saprospiraceae bacterium]|nr:SDR family NAD(P)-dependent oxidoreductase [Saprospiraceae bacterium]
MKNENAFIFITGASSGIGRELIHWFSAEFKLIVTVRKEQQKSEIINNYPDVIVVIMDFEQEQSLVNGFDEVRKILNGKSLFALINNAGIAVPGPIAFLTPEAWMRQFKVNFFAAVSCIRELFPYLIKNTMGPRIINVGSVSGHFASPFLGAYSSSKFALRGLTDSLRRECDLLGIKVVLIEPGPTQTPIWQKNLGVGKQFADTVFGAWMEKADQVIHNTEANAMPLEKLKTVFQKALQSAQPKSRYLVHKHPVLFRIFVYFVPAKWADFLVKRQFLKKQNKFRPI